MAVNRQESTKEKSNIHCRKQRSNRHGTSEKRSTHDSKLTRAAVMGSQYRENSRHSGKLAEQQT